MKTEPTWHLRMNLAHDERRSLRTRSPGERKTDRPSHVADRDQPRTPTTKTRKAHETGHNRSHHAGSTTFAFLHVKSFQKETMAKSSSSSSAAAVARKATSAGSGGSKKRQRKEVQVVKCPSAFPDFRSIDGSTRRSSNSSSAAASLRGASSYATASGNEIDMDEAIREVHALGSTGFAGKQARKHKEAQYKAVTGRDMKRQKVPLPIVRGIKKKRAEREARAEAEQKEAGVVTSTNSKKNRDRQKAKAYSQERRKSDSMRMAYGPSPDVGFMKGGVLRVKRDGRK